MKNEYDKVLTRLITILSKLSANELPTTSELAIEFNVSIRTIQTDIYKRLDSFCIEKDILGRLKFNDDFGLDKSLLDDKEMIVLSLLLNTIDESNKFYTIARSLVNKLLYPYYDNPIYTDLKYTASIDLDIALVKDILKAIKHNNYTTLNYENKEIDAIPIKIVFKESQWYLLVLDIASNSDRLLNLEYISNFSVDYNHSFMKNTLIKNIENRFF